METNYPPPLVNRPSEVRAEDIVTRSRLLADLARIGVRSGDILCVHSSFSRIGYVIGGPRTVLETLLEAVGPEGTILMPTFSGDLSDPAQWKYPAVPIDQLDDVRASLPGFHPQLTPTRGMGILPELFRHLPGAVRSPHPQSSFTAVGKMAEFLCGTHPLEYRFGPNSPVDRLCELQGRVLILGAPWNTTSLFYLSEFSMPDRTECQRSAPLEENGLTIWKSYRDLNYRNEWHDAAVHLLKTGLTARGSVGQADSLLFPARESVNEVIRWRKKV